MQLDRKTVAVYHDSPASSQVLQRSAVARAHRQLCALCQGLPHPGMDCAAYKAGAGNVSDAAIHNMAQEAKWKQCPRCR